MLACVNERVGYSLFVRFVSLVNVHSPQIQTQLPNILAVTALGAGYSEFTEVVNEELQRLILCKHLPKPGHPLAGDYYFPILRIRKLRH